MNIGFVDSSLKELSLGLWCLLNRPKGLRQRIFQVIRDYVAIRHSDWFKGGAIRITMCPCCEEADHWLGGESNFKIYPPDYASYSGDRSIIPGGSVRVTFDDGETGDCSAIAETKIAVCDDRADSDKPMLSGFSELGGSYKMENGFAPWKGAGGITVYLYGIPWLIIYVGVSGSEENKDLASAAMALLATREFFDSYSGFTVESPLEPFVECSLAELYQ